MSQTATAPPPSTPAGHRAGRPGPVAGPARPGTAAVPASASAVSTAGGQGASDTVRRLTWLSIGLVALGLLVAAVGLAAFVLQAGALQRAGANTDQLVRVQQIQADLLAADATATNAFLVGGLEPAAQRSEYSRLIADATSLLAGAAEAQPADAAALAALNNAMTDYTSTIEQARANNRQGLPVGAQYQRVASAELRAAALPILDRLVRANTDRADQEMRARWAYLAPLVALLGLTAVVLSSVWLARRFHRRLNLGLLVAAAALLIALVVTLIGATRFDSDLDRLRTGDFEQLTSTTQARLAANDAKAYESLTLIARGSGAAFEKAWQTSVASASTALIAADDQDRLQLLQRYQDVHTDIRDLDDGGEWDAAVERATGTEADSSNTVFAAFDTAVDARVATLATGTATAVDRPFGWMIGGAILMVAAGLASAVTAQRGVARRLAEYR